MLHSIYDCLLHCIGVHSLGLESYLPTGRNPVIQPTLSLSFGVCSECFFPGLHFPFQGLLIQERPDPSNRTRPLIFHVHQGRASLNVLPIGLAIDHQTSPILSARLWFVENEVSPVVFFFCSLTVHRKTNEGFAGKSYAVCVGTEPISPNLTWSEYDRIFMVDCGQVCVCRCVFWPPEKHHNYSQ